MSPKTSTLCLEIRLPTEDGLPIVFNADNGQIWDYTPAQLLDEFRSNCLFDEIRKNWPDRSGILDRAGVTLGSWLFDEAAIQHVMGGISDWSDEQPRLRIELCVPHYLAEYPWEIAAFEGVNHLAVHQALTIVRVSDKGGQPLPPFNGQLLCHVIGVQHRESDDWSSLETSPEVETIRQEIEHVGHPSPFSVEVDHLGSWKELVERYKKTGPPHISIFQDME